MNKLHRAAVLAAAVTLPLPAGAANLPAALPDADPAMWVVKDEDTTVFLFGTFHVLDGKSAWFNDEVKQAFDRSDEVVLEALNTDNPEAIKPLLERYAFDRSGKPLSKKLSPAARERLATLLKAAGAPENALDGMKPAVAGMNIAMIGYAAAGMTGQHGPEKILSEAARKERKRLAEIEGLEAQLKIIDRIPEAAQLRDLEQGLAKIDEMAASIDTMRTNWNSGNAEGLAKLMREVESTSPEAYRVMMVDRNAAWADWVARRMAKPGTIFLAIGTGHLAGPDSVQAFLAKKGIQSSRVHSN